MPILTAIFRKNEILNVSMQRIPLLNWQVSRHPKSIYIRYQRIKFMAPFNKSFLQFFITSWQLCCTRWIPASLRDIQIRIYGFSYYNCLFIYIGYQIIDNLTSSSLDLSFIFKIIGPKKNTESKNYSQEFNKKLPRAIFTLFPILSKPFNNL